MRFLPDRSRSEPDGTVLTALIGLLEEVVYVITETVRKTAMQIRWRGMYQRLLKVDPLKCILCGSQMRFTGLKRGYRLAELVMMHEPLARMQCCG